MCNHLSGNANNNELEIENNTSFYNNSDLFVDKTTEETMNLGYREIIKEKHDVNKQKFIDKTTLTIGETKLNKKYSSWGREKKYKLEKICFILSDRASLVDKNEKKSDFSKRIDSDLIRVFELFREKPTPVVIKLIKKRKKPINLHNKSNLYPDTFINLLRKSSKNIIKTTQKTTLSTQSTFKQNSTCASSEVVRNKSFFLKNFPILYKLLPDSSKKIAPISFGNNPTTSDNLCGKNTLMELANYPQNTSVTLFTNKYFPRIKLNTLSGEVFFYDSNFLLENLSWVPTLKEKEEDDILLKTNDVDYNLLEADLDI